MRAGKEAASQQGPGAQTGSGQRQVREVVRGPGQVGHGEGRVVGQRRPGRGQHERVEGEGEGRGGGRVHPRRAEVREEVMARHAGPQHHHVGRSVARVAGRASVAFRVASTALAAAAALLQHLEGAAQGFSSLRTRLPAAAAALATLPAPALVRRSVRSIAGVRSGSAVQRAVARFAVAGAGNIPSRRGSAGSVPILGTVFGSVRFGRRSGAACHLRWFRLGVAGAALAVAVLGGERFFRVRWFLLLYQLGDVELWAPGVCRGRYLGSLLMLRVFRGCWHLLGLGVHLGFAHVWLCVGHSFICVNRNGVKEQPS